MIGDPMLNRPKPEVISLLKKELIRPSVFVHIAALFLMPFWISPLIYVGLWSYAGTGSTTLLWLFIVGIAIMFNWCFYTSFAEAIRYGKRARPLRIAARAGDDEARFKYVELRNGRTPKFQRLVIGLTAFILLIPALVSLTMVNGGVGGNYLVKENGHLRSSTRVEDARNYMSAIKKRGFFSPLGY